MHYIRNHNVYILRLHIIVSHIVVYSYVSYQTHGVYTFPIMYTTSIINNTTNKKNIFRLYMYNYVMCMPVECTRCITRYVSILLNIYIPWKGLYFFGKAALHPNPIWYVVCTLLKRYNNLLRK